MTKPEEFPTREELSDPVNAAAELRAILPEWAVPLIDWSSLRRAPDFQVDPALEPAESGLLFSAQLMHWGDPLLFVVLLKYQATDQDAWLSLRMLSYRTQVEERWRRAHPDAELQPICIPVAIAFGSAGANLPPTLFEELFASE
jgi:hypothetical protein